MAHTTHLWHSTWYAASQPLAADVEKKLLTYTLPEKTQYFHYVDEKWQARDYHYYSLQPKEEKGRPVIYATGFASNGAMIPGTMGAFPEVAGRKLVFADEVLGIPYKAYLFSQGISDATMDQFAPEHLKKAVALLQTLDHQGIQETDVFAHSEWAIHALIAAQLLPHRFKNIVLNSTVGLAEEKTVLWLVVKTIKEQVSGKVKDILRGTPTSYDATKNRVAKDWDGWTGNVANMLWSSLKLMPKVQLLPYIQKVRSLWVKVSLTHAENDAAFPLEQLKAKFWGAPEKYLDGFAVVPDADHNTIIRQPWPFVEYVVQRFFSGEKL